VKEGDSPIMHEEEGGGQKLGCGDRNYSVGYITRFEWGDRGGVIEFFWLEETKAGRFFSGRRGKRSAKNLPRQLLPINW